MDRDMGMDKVDEDQERKIIELQHYMKTMWKTDAVLAVSIVLNIINLLFFVLVLSKLVK